MAAAAPFPFFSDLGPELGPLVTQGRAREFSRMGWDRPVPDPQAETTMSEAVLRWDERSEPAHARMLDWYRTLIRIRHEQADVLNPRLSQTTLEKNDDDTIVMRRGRVVVAATRATDRTVELDLGPVQEILATWEPLAPSSGPCSLAGGAVVALMADDRF